MNINEFKSILQQSDLAFVDAIETEDFQSMIKLNFDLLDQLDEKLQWRMLYGLWVVLLDFPHDPESLWMPSNVLIPGIPDSLSLEDVIQAVFIADFDIEGVDWSDELGLKHDSDQNAYDLAIQSKECRQLVQNQILAGLQRILKCDFSPVPDKIYVRKKGTLSKILTAVASFFQDQSPLVFRSKTDHKNSGDKTIISEIPEIYFLNSNDSGTSK